MSPRDLLLKWMAKHGRSAAALARVAGLSPSFLSRLLSGEREVGARAAVALSAATRISLAQLLRRSPSTR
jgi:transcriptional regulator with XRE-family HTH domain